MKITHPIDFVIPWVDGNDPAWQAERAKYSNDSGDSRIVRFRDWGLLPYWFRGVEKFAPWVNKVHFITWGHVPKWLNIEHPKLHIVNHKDYIPEKYLPTFSANPIELNIHRIDGLAEHFVYFNDDIFLTKPVKETDFFRKGLPCDTAVFSLPNFTHTHGIPIPQNVFSIGFNNILVINHHFNKKEILKKYWRKIFLLKYGKLLLHSLFMLPFRNKIHGFFIYHLSTSFLKSMFERVWEENPEVMDITCCNKFRKFTDVNQWLIQNYQFCTGNFSPISPHWRQAFYYPEDGEKIYNAIKKQKYKMICCNDSADADFELASKQLHDAFSSILPDKCSFEITDKTDKMDKNGQNG